MEQSSVTSAALASVDAGSPVMAISLRAQPADRFEQPHQLLGLAAVRERDDHIVVANGAEIAVRGFGRVQEPGRGARAREGRRDLPADDARLAHAGDDHPAATVEEQLHRALEGAVDAVDQPEDRGRFDPEHFPGEIQRGSRIGAHVSPLVRLKPDTTSVDFRVSRIASPVVSGFSRTASFVVSGFSPTAGAIA